MAKKNKEQENDTRRNWARWIGVPFQMVATLFGGYWLGSWLDNKYMLEKPWWTIGLTLLAVLVSLYQLIKQVQGIDKKS